MARVGEASWPNRPGIDVCRCTAKLYGDFASLTHARIAYADSVDIIPETAPLVVGIRSRNPIIASVAMAGNTAHIDA